MTEITAYILYVVFALGGVGVYLLMPKTHAQQGRAGAVIALLALVGLLTVLAMRMVAPSDTAACFLLFSAIAIFAGCRVITHSRPVYSAIYFVVVVIAVAAMLVLLRAEFLAIALIIIYGGAILVTYLFVIMLASQAGSPAYDRRSKDPFLAVLAGFVLMAAIAGRAQSAGSTTGAPVGSRAVVQADTTATREYDRPSGSNIVELGDSSDQEAPRGLKSAARFAVAGTASTDTLNGGSTNSQESNTTGSRESNTTAMGAAIMTRYIAALQIAGVLLLISMIGAIALSRKKVPSEGVSQPRAPLGQVGREVEPF